MVDPYPEKPRKEEKGNSRLGGIDEFRWDGVLRGLAPLVAQEAKADEREKCHDERPDEVPDEEVSDARVLLAEVEDNALDKQRHDRKDEHQYLLCSVGEWVCYTWPDG